MKMQRILFLRHGETEITEGGGWHSNGHTRLSPEGHRHAVTAGRTLRCSGHSLAPVIYSSEYRRSVDTARLIAAELGATVRPVDDLRERDLGDWTGLSTREIERQWPGYLDAWETGEISGPPGGETEKEVRDRVTEALLHAVPMNSAQLHVVVSHAGLLRGLLASNGLAHHAIAPLAGQWLTLDRIEKSIRIGDPITL